MKQKIVSIGRRPAVVLPRSLLRELGVDEGSAVDVRLDTGRGRIEITAVAEPLLKAEVRRFVTQVDRFIERHRRTLERLRR